MHRARPVDPAAEHVRRHRHADERRVAAVATAHDADAVLGRDPVRGPRARRAQHWRNICNTLLRALLVLSYLDGARFHVGYRSACRTRLTVCGSSSSTITLRLGGCW